MKKLLFVIALLSGLSVSAQEKKVIEVLQSLRNAYSKDAYGFDLKYICSGEEEPSDILDSLVGTIETEGNNYRCVLAGTETIHNDRYNIVLFKDDQIMYLSKGVTSTMSMDPLTQLDTMFRRSAPQRCLISTTGRNKIIEIGFAEDGLCKQMKLTIDTTRQRLLSVDYIVKSSMLTGSSEDNGYMVVKASFLNYHALKADPARFDENRFFKKEGNELMPVAAYNNYKIVVATPKL